MANPERNTAYTTDGARAVHTRESNGTGWFVGIIVVLALLAIGYLVFSANTGPATTVEVDNTPVIENPADPATAPAPMTEAAPATEAAPMTEAAPAAEPVAPAADAADEGVAPAEPTSPVVTTDPVAAPAQ